MLDSTTGLISNIDLGLIAIGLSVVSLIFFILKFKTTSDFIKKLPVITRSKYTELNVLSKRILIATSVMFLISVFINNSMIRILLAMIIIFMVSYGISELNILKEYVGNKKKFK